MKKIKASLLILLLFGLYTSSFSQKKHRLLVPCYVPNQTFKHFITKTPWIIQVGGNVVDDDGRPFTKFLDIKNTWNVPPSAIKVAIEKELNYNWNIELAFTYNQFKAGKIINGDVYTNSGTFMAIDLNGKKILTKAYRVEPYLFSGFGYTMRSVSKYPSIVTLNAGFGFNIWIIDNQWGLNIQGSGKFGLSSPILKTGANYLQHSIGILYKFSGNAKKLKAARLHIRKIYNK